MTGGAQSVKGGDRTGRFGVMYLRSLLAQAGVAHGEFSGGEDYLAVDVTLNFEHGAVRVQVKSGTTEPNKDGSITVPVEDGWKHKWSNCKLPVYLVYVRLEDAEPGGWVEHADLHTVLHARAQWVRVNNVSAASVRVPRENRLSADTFDVWVEDFDRDWEWGRAGA